MEPPAEREYRDMPTVAELFGSDVQSGGSQDTLPVERRTPQSSQREDTESSIGSPRVGRTRKRRASRTERSRASSLTREVETTTKKARATGGKDIKKIREQVARAEGKSIEQLETPPATLTFATSTYGREKLPQGRGEGKSGKKRKRQTPMKDTRPIEQREGWQDPEVMRALKGQPPPGVCTKKCATKKQASGALEKIMKAAKKKMVTTKKQAANPQVAKAMKAANKTKKAKKELNERGVTSLTTSR